MPLSTWTDRDQLLSDALHMRDVAMGLDRPSVLRDEMYGTDYDELSSTLPAAELELADSTWSRVQNHRDLQLVADSPVMTADATDIWQAEVDGLRQQRWADGGACGVSIRLERAHELYDVLVEHTDSIDLEEGERLADVIIERWEPRTSEVVIETVGSLQEEFDSLVSPEGEENPIPQHDSWSEAKIPPHRLAGYVEALLYTTRAPRGISTWCKPTGYEPFEMRRAFARVEDRLTARSSAERARRRSVHSRLTWTGRDGKVRVDERFFTAKAGVVSRAHYAVLARKDNRRLPSTDYVPVAPTLYRQQPDGSLVVGRPGRKRWVGRRLERPYVVVGRIEAPQRREPVITSAGAGRSRLAPVGWKYFTRPPQAKAPVRRLTWAERFEQRLAVALDIAVESTRVDDEVEEQTRA